LFTVTRHPVLQPAVREELLERVRAAAAGEGEIEPRTAVVPALAGPLQLLEVVTPDEASRRHAKRRIQTATELTPVAPVVKKVIAEMQAAVMMAAAAGGAVSSSSAGSRPLMRTQVSTRTHGIDQRPAQGDRSGRSPGHIAFPARDRRAALLSVPGCRGAGNKGPVSTATASSFLNAAGTMGG